MRVAHLIPAVNPVLIPLCHPAGNYTSLARLRFLPLCRADRLRLLQLQVTATSADLVNEASEKSGSSE